MIIREIYLDGFGIFTNMHLVDLTHGLILIAGRNESGKTTLMEFIRTALFGFPKRQWKQFYPPLRGGKHGGRILIEMQDGQRLISELSRGKLSLYTEQGTRLDTTLSDLLNGIDRKTFKRLFAIGLDELQGLDFLSRDEFMGRLLTATAGLSARQLPYALKSLKDERDRFYNPRSRKSILSQLLNKYEEINREIKQLQNEIAMYRALKEEEEKLIDDLERIRTTKRTLEQKKIHHELLLKAREPWLAWKMTLQQCQALSYLQDFPADGLTLMKNLKEKRDEYSKEIEEATLHLQNLKRQDESIHIKTEILASADRIRLLANEKEKYRSAIEDIPEVRAKTEQAHARYQKALKDLGPDWDENKFIALDTSLPVRQKCRNFEDQMKELNQTIQNLKSELNTVTRQMKEHEDLLQTITDEMEALATDCPSAEELAELWNTVNTLEGALQKKERQQFQINQLEKAIESLETRLQMAQPVFPPVLLIIASVILFVGAIFFSSELFTNPSTKTGLTSVLMIGASFFFGYLAMRLKKRANQQKKLDSEMLSSEKETLSQLKKAYGDLEETIHKLCEKLGMNGPTPEAIRERKLHLENMRDTLQRIQTLEIEHRKIKNRMEQLQQKHQTLSEELNRAESNMKQLKEEWSAWVSALGFDRDLQPSDLEILFEHHEKVRSYRESWLEIRERYRRLKEYFEKTRESIRSLFEACAQEPPEDPTDRDIDRLIHLLDAQEELLMKRQQIRDEIDRVTQKINALKQKLTDIEEQIRQLLVQTKCTDIDEFIKKARDYEKYRQILETKEKYEHALLTLTGNPSALEKISVELETRDEETVRSEYHRIMDELSKLEDQERTLSERYGRLREQIERLEREEKMSTLLFERARLHNEIKSALISWGIRVLALYGLDQAREIYEHQRQPEVIRTASTILKKITNGRYSLIMTSDEQGILLEDRDRQRKSESTWSHGLADQVYLSVRLSLAQNLARTREPLPLILDDILVRFDEGRQMNTIRALLEFSREHQIFFFTCRPEIVDAFTNVVDRYPVDHPVQWYELDDGKIIRIKEN